MKSQLTEVAVDRLMRDVGFSFGGFGMNATPGLHCMSWGTASASQAFSPRFNLKLPWIKANQHISVKEGKPPGLPDKN